MSDSLECDDCDGSGFYFIDEKTQLCICQSESSDRNKISVISTEQSATISLSKKYVFCQCLPFPGLDHLVLGCKTYSGRNFFWYQIVIVRRSIDNGKMRDEPLLRYELELPVGLIRVGGGLRPAIYREKNGKPGRIPICTKEFSATIISKCTSLPVRFENRFSSDKFWSRWMQNCWERIMIGEVHGVERSAPEKR